MTSISEQRLLFEVGSTFFITGISFISFLAASLLNERSPAMFQQLYCLSCGVLFNAGISFAHYLFYTIVDGSNYISLIAASSVFMVMLGVRIFHTKTSQEYSVVSTGNFTADNRELADMEGDDDDTDNRIDGIHTLDHNCVFDRSTVTLKLCLCTLIVFKSLSNLLEGLLFAMIAINSQWNACLIMMDRVIMALTLSAVLESSAVPSVVFLTSMVMYSCSTALGVAMGLLVSDAISHSSFDLDRVVRFLKYAHTIMHACVCGSYLYMSLLHMIPIIVVRVEGEVDTRQTKGSWSYKAMACMSFVLGYTVSLTSNVMMSYPT